MLDPVTKLLVAVGLTGALAIVGATVPPANAGVPAADEPQSPAEYEIVTGQVGEIDTELMLFALHTDDENPISIKLTEDTRYMYNGEQSDMDTVLVQGTQVAVRHAQGTALVISHRSPGNPE